jgi:hypothetical protein
MKIASFWRALASKHRRTPPTASRRSTLTVFDGANSSTRPKITIAGKIAPALKAALAGLAADNKSRGAAAAGTGKVDSSPALAPPSTTLPRSPKMGAAVNSVPRQLKAPAAAPQKKGKRKAASATALQKRNTLVQSREREFWLKNHWL